MLFFLLLQMGSSMTQPLLNDNSVIDSIRDKFRDWLANTDYQYICTCLNDNVEEFVSFNQHLFSSITDNEVVKNIKTQLEDDFWSYFDLHLSDSPTTASTEQQSATSTSSAEQKQHPTP